MSSSRTQEADPFDVLVLTDQRFCAPRSKLPPREDIHYLSALGKKARKHAEVEETSSDSTLDQQKEPQDRKERGKLIKPLGFVRQVNTLNQFHASLIPMIQECESPQAICGIVSMVVMKVLFQHPALVRMKSNGGVATEADLEEIIRFLSNKDVMFPAIREGLRHLQTSRKRYIEAHESDFDSKKAKKLYVKAWTANYEISDFICEFLKSTSTQHPGGAEEESSLPPKRISDAVPINFLRYNQFPELDIATHEERALIIAEESRFGGYKVKDGDKEHVFYNPGDSTYFVESFLPSVKINGDGSISPNSAYSGTTSFRGGSVFRTPEEWALYCGLANLTFPQLFVVDLHGHFVTALAVRTPSASQEESSNSTLDHTLLVFNTMDMSNCLQNPAVAWLYDICFNPQLLD